MLYKIASAAVLLFAAPVGAQAMVNPRPPVTIPQTQNVVVLPQQTLGDVLRAGAPVPVALSEALTTKGKSLKVGQRVRLEVAQDVMLNGRLAIPARSPVEGVLTEVRNKGMWGKSGAIRLHIVSVNINGAEIRLTGDMDSRGETGTAGVVGAIVALPIAGFFVTGTSAEMPLYMPGRAFLDQDIALAPASAYPSQSTVDMPNQSYPAAPPRRIVSQVKLVPANTASGYCIEAPPGYRGTGSKSSPAVTTGMPLCSQ